MGSETNTNEGLAQPQGHQQQQQQPHEPDEIDYFLEHETERPKYAQGRSISEAAEDISAEVTQLKVAFRKLGSVVATSSAKFFVNMALRRVMCLITVQRELVKDGRLPGPFANDDSATAPGGGRRPGGVMAAVRHVVGGFLAIPRCAVLVYRTAHRHSTSGGGGGSGHQGTGRGTCAVGALSALFRGGKVYAGFLLVNAVYRNTQNFILVNAVGPFLEPYFQSRLMRVAWLLGAFPLLMHFMSWPLKAVRNLIMTNYMADLPAPIRRNQADTKETQNSSAVGHVEGENTYAYLYSGVGELWHVLHRELGGWRGILGYGCGLEYVHSLAIVMARLAANEAFTHVYNQIRAAAAQDEIFLRPMLLVFLLNGIAETSNVMLRPFQVVSTRMALLRLPNTVSPDGDLNRKDLPPGRRYKNGLDCLCTIVREEGLLALWAGTPQMLVVNITASMAQAALMGTVWVSFLNVESQA